MKSSNVKLLFFTVSMLSALVLTNCSSGGGSSSSNQKQLQPGPQNLTATAGVQKVFLTWDPVANASLYNVYYSNSPLVTTTTGTLASSVTGTGYTHANLNFGAHHYLVTAMVTSVETAASNTASAGVNLVSFVTSSVGTGDLSTWPDAVSAGTATGLAAGDAVCQARAQAAGLTGTFKGWLSDDNNDAYCRMHGLSGRKSANCGQTALPAWAGPWVRMDGEPFAEVISKLTGSYAVLTPAKLDEMNHLAPYEYWTGTNIYGESSTDTCTGWTDSSSVGYGREGSREGISN